MEYTCENICGFLIRSRLLSPDEVKATYQRWQNEARDGVGNVALFSKWLVANKYVTEYQAALLLKGMVDDFFLNQYQILDRLGRGRMAGVYKAVHHLGQMVAIKVLPPSRAKNPHMLARFQREARLGLRLKHANVVRCFQVGEARGLYYLVMEYLEGETLDDVLQRRKRLQPNEAVRLIHQALLGLQHIHEQGMVHRDLKPSNLMLVAGATRGEDTTAKSTVKILDIGLGREMFEEGESGPADSELTAEGVLLGTPDYLAPEQARDPRTIDIRADIYSLGCVLYHTLTGQPPFPDKNLLSQMVRHATEAPKPLKEFNPAIPDGLQQIINWMMAKKPDERYPTPERAAQALQVFLVAEGDSSRPGEEPQLRKFLTWLEAGGENEAAAPAPIVPAAFAAPAAAPAVATPPAVFAAAPASSVAAAPAMPPAVAAAGVPAPGIAVKSPAIPAAARSTMKKAARHGKKPHRVAADTVRSPAVTTTPVAQAPPPAPAILDVDVELVTAETLAVPGRGLSLNRRDWILLGIGAGSVIVAGLFGMVLALLFGS